MPSNQNNCNNCGCTPSPLDSGNWESESTLGRSSSTSSNTAPANWSPSPSPGGECLIGFTKGVVSEPWSDLTYEAGLNLDPVTNCNAEDVRWSIRGDAHNAKIDQNGKVTFGDPAQIVIMVECGDVGDIMTLNIVRVRIMYQLPDGIPGLLIDITDDLTNIEVGNHIELTAQIQPEEFAPFGTNYSWAVSETILADYIVTASSLPVVNMTPADYLQQWIEFHWIDGGIKTCIVIVQFDGLILSAQTNFAVFRPSGQINGADDWGPPHIESPELGVPGHWVLKVAGVSFVKSGTFLTGVTCWCQTLGYIKATRNTNPPFQYPESGETNGLDGSFPYPSITDTSTNDTPRLRSILYNGTFNEVNYWISGTMFLMYKSNQKHSRWVSLRAIEWSATAESAYSTNAGKFLLRIPPSSVIMSNADYDAISPPNWLRIILPQ